MNENAPFLIVGDLHGYLDKLVRLLRFAGLANAKGEWVGGNAQLWFMGDFTDRGPDGIGVIDFVMRLQQDARAKGGYVGALLGNHDVGLLSARLFPHAPSGGPRGTFYGDWAQNGGLDADLQRLESRHIEWLRNLPAMALVQERLLIHADALYYLNYGETIAKVNAAILRLLHDDSPERWDQLLGYAGERLVFSERRPDGIMRARQVLAQFGGKQILHGHTPIPKLSGEAIERVTRAYAYADNLVVDVDGGIYEGGTGFVYEVPPLTESTISTKQMSAR
jgi:diadenosine tetraphosphatase ApaH/serine/threonine PP2A family protein phosphatase